MDIVTGKILKLNNWPDGKIIGIAKNISTKLSAQGVERDAILGQLDAVRQDPGTFLADPLMADLARECIRLMHKDEPSVDTLFDAPIPYPIWGRENIDDGAVAQMDSAMRLPVTVAGALMPDAHIGYGLPIGGVLATDNAVIPYAVGVDIACRMRLSLYEVSPHLLGQKKACSKMRCGTKPPSAWAQSGQAVRRRNTPSWMMMPGTPLRNFRLLKDTAMNQLGTSGTGNHFVEWGSFHLTEPLFGLEPGVYLALLSHSGSRGVGAKIADRYSKLAREKHPDLDASVKYLAWLSLDSEDGQEYWLSMELAGRFASANHNIIHQRVAAAVGLKEVAVVENHHNFAWKEKLADGRTVIVHRKGATPAGVDALGIIPGSMGDAGYLVRGKGVAASLKSASHGAGRLMSRRIALNTISKSAREEYLKKNNVTLLGGGMDESPQAYKPIEEVIKAQAELVDVLGKFTPRIVRMADEPGDS